MGSAVSEQPLYEKCARCHLFVEDNQPEFD